jgi:ribosome biogenesis GTPase A
VGEWCAGRPRIVVLTHVDAISKASQTCWHQSYATIGAARWDFQLTAQTRNQAMQARSERVKYNPNSTGTVENVLFCNAKQGQGIPALQRAIFKAGAHVQERRERRGLKERPLRVGVIGYPNVGKSALINRLLGRRRAKTANTPGVTKSLQWIRVKDSSREKEFELLDSPGIIPASLVNQEDAALLAACNCIGNKAYDNQAIAAFFMEWCKTLHTMKKETVACPQFRGKCMERYGFDPLETREDGTLPTGEDLLFQVADNKCRGDLEDASRKILQDFRTGRLGPICLQLAPTSEMDDGQTSVQLQQKKSKQQDKEQLELELQAKRQERALNALETAKQQGLKLPPMLAESKDDENDEKKNVDNDRVGKGMFDGW